MNGCKSKKTSMLIEDSQYLKNQSLSKHHSIKVSEDNKMINTVKALGELMNARRIFIKNGDFDRKILDIV
jgi:hypothetical protein